MMRRHQYQTSCYDQSFSVSCSMHTLYEVWKICSSALTSRGKCMHAAAPPLKKNLYIPPSIVQQVRFIIPPGGLRTRSHRFYTQLCVNNIKVTVNTCTCTNVFKVITTKDQSGGIYNTCSCTIGGQGLWLQTNLVLGLHPQTWPIYCHKSLAFCYNFNMSAERLDWEHLLDSWIETMDRHYSCGPVLCLLMSQCLTVRPPQSHIARPYPATSWLCETRSIFKDL